MTRASFPTITPDIARRYIAIGRSEGNAILAQIRAGVAHKLSKQAAPGAARLHEPRFGGPTPPPASISAVADSATLTGREEKQRAEVGDGNSLSRGFPSGDASKTACESESSNEAKECREALTRRVVPAATAQSSVTASGQCPPLDHFLVGDANTVRKATERSLTACESEQARLCLVTGAKQPAPA